MLELRMPSIVLISQVMIFVHYCFALFSFISSLSGKPWCQEVSPATIYCLPDSPEAKEKPGQ